MSSENDFLPFATGVGCVVDTQANYMGSGYQQQGFPPGILFPASLNKPIRQGTVFASALAALIIQELGGSVIDDGNVPNLTSLLTQAIGRVALGAAAPKVVTVPYAGNQTFDCVTPSLQAVIFQTYLTGNVNSSSLLNVSPGQVITFVISQDSAGGRAWAQPPGLPWAGTTDNPNDTNVQQFLITSDRTPVALTNMVTTQGGI